MIGMPGTPTTTGPRNCGPSSASYDRLRALRRPGVPNNHPTPARWHTRWRSRGIWHSGGRWRQSPRRFYPQGRARVTGGLSVASHRWHLPTSDGHRRDSASPVLQGLADDQRHRLCAGRAVWSLQAPPAGSSLAHRRRRLRIARPSPVRSPRRPRRVRRSHPLLGQCQLASVRDQQAEEDNRCADG